MNNEEINRANRYLKSEDRNNLHKLINMQSTIEVILSHVGDLPDKGDIILYLIDFLDEINKEIGYICDQLEALEQYER